MIEPDRALDDIIQRIEIVTTHLATLFCVLDKELNSLYQINEQYNIKNKHLHYNKDTNSIRSALSEKISIIINRNKQTNWEDSLENANDIIATLDDTVTKLESLSTIVTGLECIQNCVIEDNLKDKLVDNYINENSLLLRICRNISRLLLHKVKLEKYDTEVNDELDHYKNERLNNLERKLRETEKELCAQRQICNEYISRIDYYEELLQNKIAKSNFEILDKNSILQGIFSDISDYNRNFQIQNNKVNYEELFYIENTQRSYHLLPVSLSLDPAVVNYNILPKNSNRNNPNLEFFYINNQMGFVTDQIEVLQDCNFQNSNIDDTTTLQSYEDTDFTTILNLRDQVQILSNDLELVKEENRRLHKQNEDLKTSSLLHTDTLENDLAHIIKVVDDKQTNYRLNNKLPETAISSICKQQSIHIVGLINANIINETKPYLVMWEPIVENKLASIKTIPLRLASYGQYRKSMMKREIKLQCTMEKFKTSRIVTSRKLLYTDLHHAKKFTTQNNDSL
ncbi:uncharacterized protein CMU_032910 [Cryptosporidium muris RN66]|uniref:Uncharacterized protein n=1 Tax=Cryptosporidium muris (strain RN66) TaxID=441375 RepID=B6AFB5_CRYMR|nr:uncharacterized protein CMU_032910 [Cryptosporidium muris RN66]EEA06906.1 hypothetical protein, conserved [Cryptosporidium muris RN66]|eukprot:XP_002141255.1 hypothetical protein [Cryptosporidium muris RN66]